MLRVPDVLDRVGVSRRTLCRWRADGTFPQALRLGERTPSAGPAMSSTGGSPTGPPLALDTPSTETVTSDTYSACHMHAYA